MNINLWQQTFPVTAGHTLVAAIYKASAPTVLIASFPFPGAYTGQTQLVTFTSLPAVVYNYILYDSPDGGADGTQLNGFDIQPNISSFNTRDPLTLVANTSSYFASGTNFYGPDPSLIGWNWYPDIPGVGILEYGVDYVKTVNGTPTTQDDLTANGYQYLTSGYSIGDGEKSVLAFIPQLAATSTAVSGTFINSTTLLTSNTTLTNSAAGQAFLLQGTAPALVITLPDLFTMADDQPIFFNSAGGSHINAVLQSNTSQSFEWYNNQALLGSVSRATSIALGQCESICLYKATYMGSGITARTWQVMFGGEGMRMVGEIIYDYSMIPLNTVFCNGQLLSRTAYARLWAWVQASGTTIVADSAWNHTSTYNGVAYQDGWGYFSQGDGSTTFRVPKLWTYSYLRLKAGTSGFGYGYGYSGDFSPPYVQPHDAPTHGGGVITGGAGGLYLSRVSGGRYSGGGGDTLGGSAAVDTTMRTGPASTASTTGENLTAGFGVYALLRS